MCKRCVLSLQFWLGLCCQLGVGFFLDSCLSQCVAYKLLSTDCGAFARLWLWSLKLDDDMGYSSLNTPSRALPSKIVVCLVLSISKVVVCLVVSISKVVLGTLGFEDRFTFRCFLLQACSVCVCVAVWLTASFVCACGACTTPSTSRHGFELGFLSTAFAAFARLWLWNFRLREGA